MDDGISDTSLTVPVDSIPISSTSAGTADEMVEAAVVPPPVPREAEPPPQPSAPPESISSAPTPESRERHYVIANKNQDIDCEDTLCMFFFVHVFFVLYAWAWFLYHCSSLLRREGCSITTSR